MSDFDDKTFNSSVSKTRMLYELLSSVIRPKTQADRTCFWKICLWADKKIRTREQDAKFIDQLVDYAREASGPDAKNPAAVFMSILKKEQNYPD